MRIREKGERRRDGRRLKAVTASQKRAFYTKSTPAEQRIVWRRWGLCMLPAPDEHKHVSR